MERVAMLASADIAAPSPELCLIAGLIISLTVGEPEKVERLSRNMRAFVDAHRELCGVVRLRDAGYDREVLEAMRKAAGWMEQIEPFLIMMARR